MGNQFARSSLFGQLGCRGNLAVLGLSAIGGLQLFQAAIFHSEVRPVTSAGISTIDQEASGRVVGKSKELGEQIYRSQCQQCHGEAGEGSEHYRQSLQGDLPVAELGLYIQETMPEGEPELCIGDEALEVARYIFDEFYSPAAQQRRHPARPQFSRLTVRQFKESVADVLGSFDPPEWLPEERGLRGYYFASRHWNDKRKLAEQVEATLDFPEIVPQFDPSGQYSQLPPPEKAENQMGDGFSAYWQGSILAPRTGWYQIKVESANGFQLSLNRQDEPLIDYGVRSGDTAVHQANIFLLQGRIYPLNIYLVAFPEPQTSFRLLWTPPQGVEEVIPGRYLLPHKLSPSIALTTPFPPDDSSTGYARGISISQEWDEAVTAAAIETANWVSQNLWSLAKTSDADQHRLEKVQEFCRQFVSLAFVKELDPQETDFFIEQHFRNELPIKDQVSRVVMLALKSPRFNYPDLETRSPSLLIARQLALFLWDSVPDKELMELARAGKLIDSEICRQQIQRMLAHPRGRAKLSSVFAEWLDLDRYQDLSKDPARFPGFDASLLRDLRRSLEIFLEETLFSPAADFRQLFTADHWFVSSRMVEFYALPKSADPQSTTSTPEINQDSENSDWVRMTIESQPSAGLLTHPFLLSGLAYYRESSPIHRGVFIARKFLGRTLKQPNENFQPLSEEFDPALTNRERVTFQTRDAVCMGCHTIINPVGFSLENFDATGKFRMMEREHPIDASAQYQTVAGEIVSLEGVEDLARFLLNDPDAQQNFIRQLFQLYARQPLQSLDRDAEQKLEGLHRGFVDNHFNIRELLVACGQTLIADIIRQENRENVD
jgi:hypothetical protein